MYDRATSRAMPTLSALTAWAQRLSQSTNRERPALAPCPPYNLISSKPHYSI